MLFTYVSWLILEGQNEIKGVLSLNGGPAPKTGPRTNNQVSLSTRLSLLCDFANLLLQNMVSLSFHLHGAGVAQPFAALA
jgi:hypothetical protein